MTTIDTENQNDRPFNSFRTTNDVKAQEFVADVIKQYQNYEKTHALRKRARKDKDLQTFHQQLDSLISDLIHRELTAPGGSLALPFSKRRLSRDDRYGSPVMSKTLPDIIRNLAKPELGYIELEVGYQNPFNSNRHRQTAIRAGEKLRQAIAEQSFKLDDFNLGRHQESIVLRGHKEDFSNKAINLQYTDTALTCRYREQLQAINTWLEQADIQFDSALAENNTVSSNDRRLTRIFNKASFNQGGRLYGGFWQAIKNSQRHESITINGCGVVTLDFGQMSPRILYGMVGVLPHFEDAYDLPGWTQYRSGVKTVFNAMLHAEERHSRFPQGAGKVFKKSLLKIDDVVNGVMKYHAPISHLLYSGHGLTVMFKESEILINILLRLIDKNIVALPVHDALVVSDEDVNVTRATMLEIFKEQTGVDGMVHIDDE
jgi:hypothetical protein